MRNGRSVCPCCGLDINGSTEMAAAEDTGGSHTIRKVSAKAGVKICPVCLESVPEEQLVELDGQKLCPTCADNMRAKAAKKANQQPK